VCCIAVGRLKASVVPFVAFGSAPLMLTSTAAFYSTRPLWLYCDPGLDK
jgi:hypothetical protein